MLHYFTNAKVKGKKEKTSERKKKQTSIICWFYFNKLFFSSLYFTLLYFINNIIINFFFISIFSKFKFWNHHYFWTSIVPFHQWSSSSSLSNCSENLFLKKNVDDEKSSFLSSSNFVNKKKTWTINEKLNKIQSHR